MIRASALSDRRAAGVGDEASPPRLQHGLQAGGESSAHGSSEWASCTCGGTSVYMSFNLLERAQDL